MLTKTEGIVISSIKYGDTSLITRVYTQEHGMQSLLFNGVRSSKTRLSPALFLTFNVLDMVIYFKPGAELHRCKELKLMQPAVQIAGDVRKSAMAVFMAELIQRTVPQGGRLEGLYDYLKGVISYLEHAHTGYENLHIHAALTLCGYLGFEIEDASKLENDIRLYANLPSFKLPVAHEAIDELLSVHYARVKLHHTERIALLENIITFLSAHIDQFKSVRSLEVLKAVFS
jgi:DNA repair protein RecO (recombination protein O)